MAKTNNKDNSKAFGAGEVKKEANPEVVSADVLEPTQAQERKELAGHSEFERKTGVKFEEIDTRPVVDANPGDGKTFSERTSAEAPWMTYQKGAQKQEAKNAKAVGDQLAEEAKADEKK